MMESLDIRDPTTDEGNVAASPKEPESTPGGDKSPTTQPAESASGQAYVNTKVKQMPIQHDQQQLQPLPAGQGYPNQAAPGQEYLTQAPPGQGYPNQAPPPGQGYPNQASPPGQGYPSQFPPGQGHPQQPPSYHIYQQQQMPPGQQTRPLPQQPTQGQVNYAQPFNQTSQQYPGMESAAPTAVRGGQETRSSPYTTSQYFTSSQGCLAIIRLVLALFIMITMAVVKSFMSVLGDTTTAVDFALSIGVISLVTEIVFFAVLVARIQNPSITASMSNEHKTLPLILVAYHIVLLLLTFAACMTVIGNIVAVMLKATHGYLALVLIMMSCLGAQIHLDINWLKHGASHELSPLCSA